MERWDFLNILIDTFLGGEYKTLIEKYRKNKDDYEKKFRISCKVEFST